MKGIILAGGLGKRLGDLTRITNKHLLPIYDMPMIFYPISTLVDSGIRDILIVTGGNHAGEFLRLLGNGHQFGLKHINYAYQKGEGGIAEALGLAEHFADNDKIVVILGDNIVEKSGSVRKAIDDFQRQPEGAKILIKEVSDPGRFGVVGLTGDWFISIKEKPKRPKSNYVVTGIYMYDHKVFKIIKTLKPSRRGELEITDVNNHYLKAGELTYQKLKGWWSDSGTFESLLRSNNLVAKRAKKNQKRSPNVTYG